MEAPSLLYPPRIREGATIGVVAPASPALDPEKVPEALARLEARGFRVKPAAHLEKRDGYLAGTDQERADDLNAMFSDPEVDAILALRGGYGSCRILPLLDYPLIRAHPKTFIGYSDNTALQLALLKKAGLVTFHGPNAMEAFLPGNTDHFQRLLLEPAPPFGSFTLFSPTENFGASLKALVPGRVKGSLLGGNMTCLLRLIGTPYEPDFAGAILFLEDIGEKAYRVDGMFTHLRLAGLLQRLGGLVLGRFDHADEMERERIDGCLQREAESLGVPCVAGAPIGHTPAQIIVPQGAAAELDAGELRLSLV
jgi:muramoyltetrapeptide carboxypeptidase